MGHPYSCTFDAGSLPFTFYFRERRGLKKNWSVARLCDLLGAADRGDPFYAISLYHMDYREENMILIQSARKIMQKCSNVKEQKLSPYNCVNCYDS